MSIAPQHQIALREHGQVLVPRLLDEEELAGCREEINSYFPTAEELAADSQRGKELKRAAFFPFRGYWLNRVSTHPHLIDLVEQVLGTDDIRMGDSVLQAKYGRSVGGAKNQNLHNDAWEGSSLVYPQETGVFQRVFVIVYFTDVTPQLAPTYVVPRTHTAQVPLLTDAGLASYTPERYADLYDAERPVLAPAGSALITTGRTVHRGSAMTADVGHRFALFTNYHAAASTWLRSRTFVNLPGAPEGDAAREFMVRSEPRQRQLLGFPPPGHPYWTEQSLKQVAELYPGMDMTPYQHVAAACGLGGFR